MSLVRPIAPRRVFWILAVAATHAAPPPGMPPLRVFTARDTGVATMAWSAAQDPDGTLYFGCNTVVSFDGDRWRAERMDPTYLVRGLDLGPDGRLWAGGVNQLGWFERSADGGLAYHSLMGKLPPGSPELGEVWRAYAEGAGRAVFVTRNRVLRWDGRAMQTWEFPGMNLFWASRTARAIYLHYPPTGLLRLDPAGPVVVIPAASLGSPQVRWLDDAGEDWTLLTTQGFLRFRQGRCVPVDSPASAFARAYTPTSVVRLRDGAFAVGTLRGGIAVIEPDGALRRIFNQHTGLPANQIYSLFVDRDGALWGLGPAHIFRLGLTSGTFLYTARGGYPAGGCDSLAEQDGAIFAASHSDLLRLGADPSGEGAGAFSRLPVSSNRFYCLLASPPGLVVGTLGGLGLWSEAGLRSIGRPGDAVFRSGPSRAQPGRILASLSDRVVAVDPRSGAAAVVADSLPDYGDSVADEPSGRVWVGTPSRGLFVAGPGQVGAEPAAPRFGPLPVAGAALVAVAGSTVVALTDSGAFYLDPQADAFRPVADFPRGRPAALSNPDSRGQVWAALEGTDGRTPQLGRIAAGPGGVAWTPVPIEGLGEIGSVLGLRLLGSPEREELWVAGTQALLRADLTAVPSRRPPAPITRAWAQGDGPASVLSAGQTLAYSNRTVHAEFSSRDFGMREQEGFETMLVGAETAWTPAHGAAERDLSGLRDGRYDLRARLVAGSGAPGPESSLPFAVAPPWWRDPAVRASFVGAAALGVAGLLRLRTRALRRRARELEHMVRQRTAELEKANAAKTEFVASMSHEIRNPMGGIIASALELAATPLGARQAELVTTLRGCATFLSTRVEDDLDFAAIEAGAYQVNRTSFRPRGLLETVVVMVGASAAARTPGIVVDPDLPERVLGDPSRIQQVVVNFTLNALKFGGTAITLSARRDEDHVVFGVADDGPGIPPEEQRNLFVRFSRLKAARTSAVPGTGLGLAVSRELAERMQGSVGVVSRPGQGALFFLRLPLEAAGAPAPAADVARLRGRALVVEDVPYNARALAFMLGQLGLETDLAADGRQALAALDRNRYRAVFLDCDLPEVDGFEVARRFRAAEAPGPRTLLIATTALATTENERACRAAGMDRFVAKPVTPEKLRRALGGGGVASSRAGAGLDLALLAHLTDGTSAGLEAELGRYCQALGEALAGVKAAHGTGPHRAVTRAVHRVLALARMVDATELASAARDLQACAGVYSEPELAAELDILARRGAELLQALAAPGVLSGSPAA